MQYSLIPAINTQQTTQQAVLFFNGWGMDARCIPNGFNSQHDLVVVYDYQYKSYQDLHYSEELHQILSRYKSVTLIAWSFGVWAASQCYAKTALAEINLSKKYAINGTPIGIDGDYGVTPRMVEMTVRKLSESSLLRFYRNMFEDDESYQCFLKTRAPTRAFENIKSELIYLQKAIQASQKDQSNKQTDCFYDEALIGSQDRIFTSHATRAYYQYHSPETKIQEFCAPHFMLDTV